MVQNWVLTLVSVGYAALLFAVAWWGDRHPQYSQGRTWLRPLVYSLSLAVYCSSWTFYGAVGTASRTGLGYLPIYLGPLLMLLFGWRILERLALIAQSQNTVSIADFIAARYGRAQRLAALVALIALIAAVPYLALQYKAVAISLAVLGGYDAATSTLGDPALYVAALMALFAILYGTRQVDASEHRPGMMLAIALESLVKLIALIAVGVFAIGWLGARDLHPAEATRALLENAKPVGFIGQTLLAFAAIICLPRQFHVAVVECVNVADIRRARWLFGAYLVLISLMVLPIAGAGTLLIGDGAHVDADSLVLALPLSEQRLWLALAAYVGGFSAATGMVIVASVALATMVSNDLVMPPLLRRGWAQRRGDMAATVLWVRRVAIVLLAALAYGYYRTSGSDTTLAAYGLMAFAAVAQFAPALIGGLYWRGASRQGVEAGLLLGFAMWIYTLLLPALTEAGWFDRGWLDRGPFAIGWLRPHQLFGLVGWDPLTHGTFWSLLVNIGALLLVSARWRPSFDERLRSAPFLDPYAARQTLVSGVSHSGVQVGDLLALAGRIIGERPAQRAFGEQAEQQGRPLRANAAADRAWVQFTERLLAAAIGASSARLVLTSTLKGSGMDVAEVVAVLDEAGQELRFNRGILSSTLENLDQGVSVVDPNMRLVSWNRRYQEMFEYPDGMLYVGRPVADLIRYNAERGELGPLEPAQIGTQIDKRIAYMRAGSPHVFERVRASGQVIEMRGQPLPGGGYVTSYSDVTEYKRAEQALRGMNETLEQRVAARTREADAAQQSRTRFFAALSHDVLQPLNAARLFTSALRESTDPGEQRHLAERVDTSLRAAEELLDGLLDISRLDAGALQPALSDFDAGDLLRQLLEQYAPVAAGRGIDLRLYPRGRAQVLPVRSDRRLLRRVLQNFIANALRYTRSGRIVLAARLRGDHIELQVWDTGPGIPEHHLRQIFEEFRRFEQPTDWGEQGLGLGLSICQRISHILNHHLDVRSRPGHGSMFSIRVPRGQFSERGAAHDDAALREGPLPSDTLAGLRVLCLDNDPEILDGMRALLHRWHVRATTAATVDAALAAVDPVPDVLLVDYHLHDRLHGLDALDALRARAGTDVPGALLTADGSDALKRAARARGYRVLIKPIKPASLRAFLAAQRRAPVAPAR
ncbi:hybrid sensor histidine kinase/response regulator [Luteimonas aquatica]|uniref:hybrid sensor histidine kinase/response regulator n=1 Tax=Luteimonas aquatica TaxID=450364 RepID=UPI001F583760|nr:PAS domain-containing hybrid sensor histidine kinase/response regulator [Luteimonas aquatica]